MSHMHWVRVWLQSALKQPTPRPPCRPCAWAPQHNASIHMAGPQPSNWSGGVFNAGGAFATWSRTDRNTMAP